MTSDTSDHDEPDPIEWEAEQNEMAIRLSAADLWDDYCIRRLDPAIRPTGTTNRTARRTEWNDPRGFGRAGFSLSCGGSIGQAKRG
ncbi:hypothetical protein D3C87_341220 [compost metagenome]